MRAASSSRSDRPTWPSERLRALGLGEPGAVVDDLEARPAVSPRHLDGEMARPAWRSTF